MKKSLRWKCCIQQTDFGIWGKDGLCSTSSVLSSGEGQIRDIQDEPGQGRKSPPKSLWKHHHLSQRRESLHAKMKCLQRLPWWLRGKESACQGRRHGFGLWSRKIPHATEQLSAFTTTTEPALSSPRAQLPSLCAAAAEARSPQSPCAAARSHCNEQPTLH